MAFRMLHTTTHSSCFLVFSTMIGAYPPHEVSHWEQLAVFTNRRKRNGSSSFFFALQRASTKSVLFHKMFFIYALLASMSANTCCQIPSIASLVQTGIHLLSHKSPSLHTFAVPRKVFHRTSLIHLWTTTVPSSLQRKSSCTSSSKPCVFKTPPESTSAYFLFSSSLLNSLVVSTYFLRITVSIQQSPKSLDL